MTFLAKVNFQTHKKRYLSAIYIAIFLVFYLIIAGLLTWVQAQNSLAHQQTAVIILSIFFLLVHLAGLNVSVYEILKTTTHAEKRLFYRIWNYFFLNCLFLLPLTTGDSFHLAETFNVFSNYYPYNVSIIKEWFASWLYWWVILILYVTYFFSNIIFALLTKHKINWSWKDTIIANLFFFLMLFAMKALSLYILNTYFGFMSVIYLLCIVICNDSFAFLGGMKWGKTKLAPKISPHKTQAGAVIGLVTGTFITFFFGAILLWSNVTSAYLPFFHEIYNQVSWKTYLFLIILPIVLSITSQLGDLLYSACKRLYNIKDFSNLIPGHGGFLDRFDSHSVVFVMMLFLVFLANN